MPDWIPGRLLIGYLTGAILLVAGVCILLAKKTLMAATYLGAWIVALVLFVYGPILIAALLTRGPTSRLKGSTTSRIHYFLLELFSGLPARLCRPIKMPTTIPANPIALITDGRRLKAG